METNILFHYLNLFNNLNYLKKFEAFTLKPQVQITRISADEEKNNFRVVPSKLKENIPSLHIKIAAIEI